MIQTADRTRLTRAGWQLVATVRATLDAIATSGLPIAEIQQRVDALHQQLVSGLAADLGPARPQRR